MSETIKDGRGSGNRARIDDDGRLHVFATTSTAMSHTSERHARAFSIPILNQTLATADQEYNLAWLRNDDPDYTFRINRFYIGWNGGDTNHNRVVDMRMYAGASVPTANHSAFSPSNLNLTSARTAATTGYLWDGVGNGMTVASQGVKALANYFGQGTTTVEVDGTILVGYGQVILITATPEEAGKLSIITSLWFSEEVS